MEPWNDEELGSDVTANQVLWIMFLAGATGVVVAVLLGAFT